MKIKEITGAIENFAPLYLQEGFDNAGMQVGNVDQEITGVLLCTDVVEDIVDEAIECGANLIVSHHPLIFKGLKKIVGRTSIERMVVKAIKHDIAIYCAHTNLDNARGGVSYKMAEKLGLKNVEVLAEQQEALCKVVVFVPQAHGASVANAMCDAGAGRLGNYDHCSYQLDGVGHYRALDGAQPAMGKVGELHTEPETRIEVLVNKALCGRVVEAMLKAHPYEEPAYDIIALDNANHDAGLGVIGDIEPTNALSFLTRVKQEFGARAVRYSGNTARSVQRVAMCGGAGSELVSCAIAKGADVYITGDMKYHEFMGQEDRIILVDIGHYESECATKEIFLDIIQKKNPNFAVTFARKEKNQINYL